MKETKKCHIGRCGMMQQGVLQPGTMTYGMKAEHSKGVHRVSYNTTAVAGTMNPDGLECSTIQQQFDQHALGCTGMRHELVCKQHVPTVTKVHKPCSSTCIIGGGSSSSYIIIQISHPGAL